MEGTVLSLLEDDRGHIVGVLYKENKTASVKVNIKPHRLFIHKYQHCVNCMYTYNSPSGQTSLL